MTSISSRISVPDLTKYGARYLLFARTAGDHVSAQSGNSRRQRELADVSET
jgi:hypothetical protein